MDNTFAKSVGRDLPDVQVRSSRGCRELLKMNFEDSAEWRRQTAKEDPHDFRNLQAATIFDRLAETVNSIDDATFNAYYELFEDCTDSEHHSEMLRTIGFILACFPSAFFAVVFMGDTHQDNVPIVFIPVIIAIFPLLAARTRIARRRPGRRSG